VKERQNVVRRRKEPNEMDLELAKFLNAAPMPDRITSIYIDDPQIIRPSLYLTNNEAFRNEQSNF
jgi:hypothetical protein